MAKLSSDGKYVTVVKGDTLWAIASKHLGSGSKYQQLATWNNISDPNKITIGQKIYLSKNGASSSSTTKKTTSSSNTVIKKTFGPLASNDRKIYASWTWGQMSKKENNKTITITEKFLLIWRYYDINGVVFDTNTTSISVDQDWHAGSLQTTYDIPENARSVHLKVKPVSKTYKKKENNKEVEKTYFTANWSDWWGYTVVNPITTPSDPPQPEIDENNKLTITLEGLDTTNFTHVQFEIIQNDTTRIVTSESLAVNSYGYVTYSYNVAPGNEYKIRYKVIKGKLSSDWSKLSSSVQSTPSTPASIITCKGSEKGADDLYTVYLEWEPVKSADTYDVQYTTVKDYFDTINGQTTTVSTEDATTSITIVQLDPGEHFFRIRAVNKKGTSDWTDIVSVKMGEPPGVPTTWESTTRAIMGEPLNLYWVHNSLDGSTQTWARLFLSTDGGATARSYEIKNDGYYRISANNALPELISSFTDDDQKDQTSVCEIDTSSYGEDTVLTWWVCTAGITNTFGKVSTYRSIDIYEKPSLDLLVTNDFTVSDDGKLVLGSTPMETLESFPFYIKAVSSNTSQIPIGYSLSITANSSYNTVDNLGNDKTISSGDEVYSKYFDISEVLVVQISADNIDLENGVEYTVTCTVSMNSGLTATAYAPFNVSWTDEQYFPNAEIAINMDTYTASIRPYCEENKFVYYRAYEIGFTEEDEYGNVTSNITYYISYNNPVYPGFNFDPEIIDGSTIDYVYMPTGEQVHLGKIDNTPVYYIIAYVDADGNAIDPIYYEVKYSITTGWVLTNTVLDPTGITRVYSDEGHEVLLGSTLTIAKLEYCIITETELVEDVTLSVYRREFDGAFTEIATDLSNVNNTFVTDPHPALDYARYRIVAKTKSTGAISYYDLPGHPVGCTSIIIQWDEEWSSFNQWSEDILAEPPWTGSLLKLPYNVDEYDNVDQDVTLAKYIGRKRPVAYYGTQLGETASWDSRISKEDIESIYALRRLSIWCGNVYVRSPSGVGYWAHVKPSFSLKHGEVTVPVTLNITRVEGGI
jgi:hypothetical protein